MNSEQNKEKECLYSLPLTHLFKDKKYLINIPAILCNLPTCVDACPLHVKVIVTLYNYFSNKIFLKISYDIYFLSLTSDGITIQCAILLFIQTCSGSLAENRIGFYCKNPWVMEVNLKFNFAVSLANC